MSTLEIISIILIPLSLFLLYRLIVVGKRMTKLENLILMIHNMLDNSNLSKEDIDKYITKDVYEIAESIVEHEPIDNRVGRR